MRYGIVCAYNNELSLFCFTDIRTQLVRLNFFPKSIKHHVCLSPNLFALCKN